MRARESLVILILAALFTLTGCRWVARGYLVSDSIIDGSPRYRLSENALKQVAEQLPGCPVRFEHLHGLPIGVALKARYIDRKVYVVFLLSKTHSVIRQLVRERILTGLSISFRPIRKRNVKSRTGKFLYLLIEKLRVVEMSVTDKPADSNAKIIKCR